MKYKMQREGASRKSLQGLTTKVVNYINRDKVLVEVLETKEAFWTDWKTFNKGLVRGDLSKMHTHDDCSFNQARFYIVSMALLFLAFIGALILLLTR